MVTPRDAAKGPRLPSSCLASLPYRALQPALLLSQSRFRRPLRVLLTGSLALWLLCNVLGMGAQSLSPHQTAQANAAHPANQTAAERAQRNHLFLAARGSLGGRPAAQALLQARAQHLLMPRVANLSAAWQALGPVAITSATFGDLTGRITALALDANDATGNTLYVGTTGGGVYKSTSAAGALAAVTFTALTDDLAVFAPNAGAAVAPSLSIGAVAVQPLPNPVLLAGTGDPNDATDSYYGEGLLRSADGGQTWTLAQGSQDGVNGNHSFAGLATAGIAFSTATPALVVAAMSTSAEAATVAATNSSSIPGLYTSTDAGLTWQMATVYDGAAIVQQPQPYGTGQVGNAATAVVYDPLRQMFFAAIRSHGFYSSSDGMTWTRLVHQPGTGLSTANCPVGVNGTGSATCPHFRGTLAVQPVTGDLYALTVDAQSKDQGLWQDLCTASNGICTNSAPVFATRLDNGALEVGQGAAGGSTAILQGTYNLTLSALPAAGNGTLLFAGTVDLYRCSLAAGASSCSLRNTTNALDGCNAPAGVAAAQHALAGVAGSTAPLLFAGNDGGLWRSLDGVAETGQVCSASDNTHFDNLNLALGTGGSLAEVVGFAQAPADAKTLLAGLGANGSAATGAALPLASWPLLSAGEGGQPLLDPNATANWYLAIGAGVNVKACTLGSGCAAASFVPPATIGAAQTAYDASLLDVPALLDPAATEDLLVGTCRVWRGPAANSSTWNIANAISPAFDGSTTPCAAGSPLIRSLAAGGPARSSTSAQLSGSPVIYAGLAGAGDGGGSLAGHVFVTTTAGSAYTTTSWHDTALPNPGGFDVSALFVDPHDATGATVYATVMGFGTPHVFRSTNFGGTWTNVSANLPNAPANAVLVDPNDANTVYVALDTGVYATQSAAACSPTANCWSVLGTDLPNAPVTALAASAALPTSDGRNGLLRAATYGRGLWQTPLLTASAPAQIGLSVSPASLTFAAQQVSTSSAAQTLTLTSTGNTAVVFSAPALTGDFSISANSCTGLLAPGATCTISIVFTPTLTGSRSGLLTVYANIPGGQLTVALSGTGTAAAAIVLTPASLTFSPTLVGQMSASQIINVANTGGNTATLQTPIVSGDFQITANTCATSLPASTACAVQIVFAPTASGARAGTFSVTDSAGTQTAQLTGTGNAPATDGLSPLALTFAQQTIATTSAAQQVVLTNSGDVALTLIASAVTPGDFAANNGCGTSLAAHSSCAVSVTFTPTASGTRTATLTVTDQFRAQSVQLTGTGVVPAGVSVTPTEISFGTVAVGRSSAAQMLTLTNNGGLPLSIAGVTISSGFTIVATTCTATLAPGGSCTYTLSFAPAAAGPASGTFVLSDNAPTPMQTVNLTGTGLDFSLTANGPTTATLSSGGTASYPLLLSSVSSLSGTVTFTCTGAPTNATCTVAPATAQLGSTVSLVATVQTGIQVVRLEPPPLPARGRQVFWALLLPASLLMAVRRRNRERAMLLGLLLLAGCGAARIIPGAVSGGGGTGGTGTGGSTYPTPSGTYNLVVTGSSGGLTHSVGLTLIVQ